MEHPRQNQRQDPAVARVERLLDRAATARPAGPWRGRARQVLYVCACETEHESPDWIIYSTDDGIGWRRWPDDLPEEDEVDAPSRDTVHTDPADLLDWLKSAADPARKAEQEWSVVADSPVSRPLARWIRDASGDLGR